MEANIQTCRQLRDKVRRRHIAPRTDEELRTGLAAMTMDAQQSGEEVCALRTQLDNVTTLAVRSSPAAAKGLEN
jgi:hypothetical protein